MAVVLMIIGAVFMVAAIRGSQDQLFDILKSDFSGPTNFFTWGLALFFIGVIGYSPKLRPLSNAFFVLFFVVIFLTSGRGFFDQFTSQIRS